MNAQWSPHGKPFLSALTRLHLVDDIPCQRRENKHFQKMTTGPQGSSLVRRLTRDKPDTSKFIIVFVQVSFAVKNGGFLWVFFREVAETDSCKCILSSLLVPHAVTNSKQQVKYV